MTGATFILTALKTLDISKVAAEECGIPPSRIFILDFHQESIPEDFQSWNSLLSHGEKDWLEVEDPDNTSAAYVSTSGTSGLPKAAIIPHSYFVSQGEFQDRIYSSSRYKVNNPAMDRDETDKIGHKSDSDPSIPRLHYTSTTRPPSS